MSVTLEQVEQLRAHAAVSYEEARRALEACDGDLLDALILLEREGRIPPGGGRGAFFTTQPGAAPEPPPSGPTRGPEASGKDEKRFWGLAVTAGGHRGREEREQGYLYPHDFPRHWVRQQYLPDLLADRHYYRYGDNKNEQAARRYWDEIKGPEA